MHLRCPDCRNPIELVDELFTTDHVCPSCTSTFSLLPKAGDHREESRTIAHFELLEILGTGAFGAVWKARDTELDRFVAVKLPRKGQLDAVEAEVFLREARAAAQLKHPNIVAIHEVGRDDDALYIVSDMIDGVTLGEWLENNRPTPQEAADLCARIADALHHAHEQGIIHRDLKPSNIMLDADGAPHVMDFGLAKREAGEITMTADGKVLGTPMYMPPEQAQGEGHHVDRRADVYSLGVVLYEMLTGERPFRGSVRMLLHQVIHDDPPGPRKLDSRIPRDLETITLKAMAKEPPRRYATAKQLADDLLRYAAGEPILARPVSRLERAWRWCRRNPAVAGLLAAVFLLLLATTVVSTVSAVTIAAARDDARAKEVAEREQRQRAEAAETQSLADAQRANQEAATALESVEFLKGIFRASDPLGIQGVGFRRSDKNIQTLLARELLDAGAGQIQEGFRDRPRLKARLLDIIGDVYRSNAVYDKAEELLAQALEIRRNLRDTGDRDLELEYAESIFHLGWLRHELGDVDTAEQLYREAWRIRERFLGADDLTVAEVKMNLAWLLSDVERDKAAEPIVREVLRVREEKLGKHHRDTEVARLGLAIALLDQGKNVQAILIVSASLGGKDFLAQGMQLFIRATSLRREGKLEEAIPLYGELVEIARQKLGDHFITAAVLGDYAGLLRDAGKRREAERHIVEALDIGRRIAPNHPLLIRGLTAR